MIRNNRLTKSETVTIPVSKDFQGFFRQLTGRSRGLLDRKLDMEQEERHVLLSKLHEISAQYCSSAYFSETLRRLVKGVEKSDWPQVLEVSGFMTGFVSALLMKSRQVPSPAEGMNIQRNQQTEPRKLPPGATDKEIVLHDFVRPRMRAKLGNLVTLTERCSEIHETHTDDALLAITARHTCHRDIYESTQELSRYITVDRLFTENGRKHVASSRDSLQAATAALAGMRIDEAPGHTAAARDSFAEV